MTKTNFDKTLEEGEKKKIKCPFCGKEKSSEGIICPCEVAPKYDLDYEEWRNK